MDKDWKSIDNHLKERVIDLQFISIGEIMTIYSWHVYMVTNVCP